MLRGGATAYSSSVCDVSVSVDIWDAWSGIPRRSVKSKRNAVDTSNTGYNVCFRY